MCLLDSLAVGCSSDPGMCRRSECVLVRVVPVRYLPAFFLAGNAYTEQALKSIEKPIHITNRIHRDRSIMSDDCIVRLLGCCPERTAEAAGPQARISSNPLFTLLVANTLRQAPSLAPSCSPPSRCCGTMADNPTTSDQPQATWIPNDDMLTAYDRGIRVRSRPPLWYHRPGSGTPPTGL